MMSSLVNKPAIHLSPYISMGGSMSIWNAKVVKNWAAYCGVSRRVFERCGVYLNVEMNIHLNVQMNVQMNVQLSNQMNVQLNDQKNAF